MIAYRGETLSKKFYRYHVWSTVMAELGGRRFFDGPHLVLLSRALGDVSMLVGLGVPQESIVGVDTDDGAIAECRHRFPGVQTYHGDVGRYARERSGMRFVSSYLDFCGQLTNDRVRAIQSVLTHLHGDGSVFGTVLLRGREKGGFLRQVKEQLAEVALLVASGRRDADAPDPVRGTIFGTTMLDWGLDRGIYPAPIVSMHYQSISDEGKGSPMQILMHRVLRRRISKGSARRDSRAFAQYAGTFLQSRGFFTTGLRTMGRHDPSEDEMRDMILTAAETFDGRVLETGCKLDAATIFNVQRSQLAAWKAHASRESYGSCAICRADFVVRDDAVRMAVQQVIDAGAEAVGGLCDRHAHVVMSDVKQQRGEVEELHLVQRAVAG